MEGVFFGLFAKLKGKGFVAILQPATRGPPCCFGSVFKEFYSRLTQWDEFYVHHNAKCSVKYVSL